MKNDELCNFFCERYPHWLEYAQFYCARLQIPVEANDLLNYVLCMVWYNYDHATLIEYMHIKTKDGTRLDFHVMSIVKRNLYSNTAPYIRHLKKEKERFVSMELFLPHVFVYDPESQSPNEIQHERFERVMTIFERCDFTDYERALFVYHCVEGKDLKAWNGPESLATRYRILRRMIDVIKKEIEKEIEQEKRMMKMRKF